MTQFPPTPFLTVGDRVTLARPASWYRSVVRIGTVTMTDDTLVRAQVRWDGQAGLHWHDQWDLSPASVRDPDMNTEGSNEGGAA